MSHLSLCEKESARVARVLLHTPASCHPTLSAGPPIPSHAALLYHGAPLHLQLQQHRPGSPPSPVALVSQRRQAFPCRYAPTSPTVLQMDVNGWFGWWFMCLGWAQVGEDTKTDDKYNGHRAIFLVAVKPVRHCSIAAVQQSSSQAWCIWCACMHLPSVSTPEPIGQKHITATPPTARDLTHAATAPAGSGNCCLQPATPVSRGSVVTPWRNISIVMFCAA